MKPEANADGQEAIAGCGQQVTPPDSESVSEAAGSRSYDFRSLAGTAREIIVLHSGQQYRLRATRNGGLILTK